MTDKYPLVSVFLPTYNQQDFIRESIESVLNQDYENLEIVIGDDCSQDNTWQVVQEYQDKFPQKIKSFRNPQNLGITKNCNEVLKRCTGKYVVYTAGDDLLLPGKISLQVQYLEDRDDIILCGHKVEVFFQDNTRLPYIQPATFNSVSLDVKQVIRFGMPFLGQSIMVRASAIPDTGYEDSIPIASDFMFWIEVLKGGGKVGFIEGVYAKYRRHSFNSINDWRSITSDVELILNTVASRYPEYWVDCQDGLVRNTRIVGLRLWSEGKRYEAREKFLKVLMLRPSWCSTWIWLIRTYLPIGVGIDKKIGKSYRWVKGAVRYLFFR